MTHHLGKVTSSHWWFQWSSTSRINKLTNAHLDKEMWTRMTLEILLDKLYLLSYSCYKSVEVTKIHSDSQCDQMILEEQLRLWEMKSLNFALSSNYCKSRFQSVYKLKLFRISASTPGSSNRVDTLIHFLTLALCKLALFQLSHHSWGNMLSLIMTLRSQVQIGQKSIVLTRSERNR